MTRPGRMRGATLGLLVWLAGCSAMSDVPSDGGPGIATVMGTVTYRERIALPPAAVIKVQLVDVSRADAPAIVMGEQITQAAGKQVPFAFVIDFDPARIEASHTYAVQACVVGAKRHRLAFTVWWEDSQGLWVGLDRSSIGQ